MGIFDNATSITIGDKEVVSITIDGGTIYEKESPAPTCSTVTVTVTYEMDVVSNADILFTDDKESYDGKTGSNGECTLQVPYGEWELQIYKQDLGARTVNVTVAEPTEEFMVSFGQ